MRIGGVDFPEALLTSRREGKLVVFAGAGVSIPSPSNYPDFRKLATEIAPGVLTLGEHEPIDQFLGRLKDHKVKVHNRVKEILSDPDSKPNSVHFDLLRLFESPETLRLVTTNFDAHFSTAALDVFRDHGQCEIHYAPALPLGHSFYGIVYLHGGVDKPVERLVLTDSDFGRAYLTEGWARLFLQRTFETFTVLFVGYSHNDPVMNYLARGFTPEMGASRRFALVPVGEEEKWNYRGIAPITYRLSPGPNSHAALPEALGLWAAQARLGTLEKEQRIKAIVGLPPPIDPEVGDFIEDALSDVATARFFTRHADSVLWMKWVEEKKLLRRLYDPAASLTDVDYELGAWIADKLMCRYPGETLAVLRRQGQRLHPYLWTVIARKLARDWSTEKNRGALRRLVAVLINLRVPGTGGDALEHIAASFVFPDDTDVALLVFEHLTRPILTLEHDLWGEINETEPKEDVTFKIESNGDGFWTDHLWTRFFQPNLEKISEKIEPILFSHLQLAYFLSHADKGIKGGWDTLSLSRNLVEQLDHGRQNGGLGVLVDAAFEIIKWNTSNRSSRSDALIELWFSADSFILKRLAIYGVAQSSHWTGDRKLSWLLDNDLFYTLGLKHEVFTVLQDAYPRSSEKLRRAIVERANRGRSVVPEGAERTAEYERYNLLYWLHQSDPDCPIARTAFTAMQEAHPDFGKRDRPDLDVEFGPVHVGLQSPISVDELLSKPPADWLDYLVSYEPERPFGSSREGLLENVNTAAVRNYEWGWELCRLLHERGILKIDLWATVVRSWAASELADSAWKMVLTLLNGNERLHAPLASEISNLLEDGIKKSAHPIPSDCFDLADDLSKRIWATLRTQNQVPKPTANPVDWVMRAINHPAGRLSLFWLSWLARQRKEAGSNWKGIPSGLRTTLEKILGDDSYAAELNRVLMASQLNLLFAADEQWAKSYILPLFDWSVDEKRAAQSFHGFLTWGHQTEELLPYLLPAYEKAFSHLAGLGKVRNRFTEYLAGLAFASSLNPLANGWLGRFLLSSDEQDRRAWATFVLMILRGSTDVARSAAWQTWIKEYWNRRISGIPVALEAIELGVMIEWSLYLGSGFPEAIDAIAKGPSFKPKESFIFRELENTTFPDKFPYAAAQLVLKVLENMVVVYFDLDKVEDIVRRIVPLGASLVVIKNICNQLGRLGYPRAADLDAWTQTQHRQD